MWKCKIAEKGMEKGALKVLLAYTDGTGTNDFTEYVSFQDPATLDIFIANRLNNLNAVADFVASLPVGEYQSALLSTAKPLVAEIPAEDPVDSLARLKYLVDLGVKQTTDTDYQAALQAAKDSVK